jgi:uncharacterized membrane protein YidH (DUF202 family)
MSLTSVVAALLAAMRFSRVAFAEPDLSRLGDAAWTIIGAFALSSLILYGLWVSVFAFLGWLLGRWRLRAGVKIPSNYVWGGIAVGMVTGAPAWLFGLEYVGMFSEVMLRAVDWPRS